MATSRRPKSAETLRQELARAYMVTFASEEGQRVLADLERRYGKSSITSDYNPNRTMVLEGARLAYLSICEYIEEGRKYAGGSDTRIIVAADDESERDDLIDTEQPERRPRLANWG